MGTTIITGAFTLAGVILGFALDWLRASAERRRADARELADLIAQLRDTVGTLRDLGRIFHGWSEAMPGGDVPPPGLVKAALDTTSAPMDTITALTRRIAITGGGRYQAAAGEVRRATEALPPLMLRPGPGYGERDSQLGAALDALGAIFDPPARAHTAHPAGQAEAQAPGKGRRRDHSGGMARVGPGRPRLAQWRDRDGQSLG
jgi:hypothetical protein